MSATPSFTAPIRTAACVCIGDEILGGKIDDTNSSAFAKFCFAQGIELKRIEVIPDDEADIISTIRRVSSAYDFVVTSGGIGPTPHDDLTYPSIAKAYGLDFELHQETLDRMKRLSRNKPSHKDFDWETPSPALTGRKRMATLPKGEGVRNLFVVEDSWVPICVVNYNIHILPGVPQIFATLLEGLGRVLKEEGRLDNLKKIVRVLISTPLHESEVADYFVELQKRVADKGVKVGSYPRWGKERNTVTLVGSDIEFIESLVPEVEKNVQGKRVEYEGEDDPAQVEGAGEKAEENVGKP